jgi:hypothetical protein
MLCVNVQGLVAGMNAARCAAGKPLVTFTREGSYIGTLIDDLITKVRAVGRNVRHAWGAERVPPDLCACVCGSHRGYVQASEKQTARRRWRGFCVCAERSIWKRSNIEESSPLGSQPADRDDRAGGGVSACRICVSRIAC